MIRNKNYLRLVLNRAWRYHGRGVPLSDLIQAGNIGLMRAVDRYDHRKGRKFSTYATWWINHALSRAIIDHARTVKLPVYLFEQRYKVQWTASKLNEKFGEYPLLEEVAREAGVTTAHVKRTMELSYGENSLDSKIKTEEQTTFLEFLTNEGPTPEFITAKASLAKHIKEALELPTEREQEIIRMRFGVEREGILTLDEIGEKFCVTRERIRQIEQEALRKIATSQMAESLKSFLQ